MAKQTVKCKICNTEVSSLRVLGMHMQSFYKEVALKCEICSRAFFTKRGLKDHKRNHRSIEQGEQQIEINTDKEVQENRSNDVVELNNNRTDVGSSGLDNFVIIYTMSNYCY